MTGSGIASATNVMRATCIMTHTTTRVSGTGRMTTAGVAATPTRMTATATVLGQRGRANSHQEPQ